MCFDCVSLKNRSRFTFYFISILLESKIVRFNLSLIKHYNTTMKVYQFSSKIVDIHLKHVLEIPEYGSSINNSV